MSGEWTEKDGRANNSDEYRRLVNVVEQRIRGDAFKLLAGQADATAALIMSHLAYKENVGPLTEVTEDRDRLRHAIERVLKRHATIGTLCEADEFELNEAIESFNDPSREAGKETPC